MTEPDDAIVLQRLHVDDLPLQSEREAALEILSVLEVYAGDGDLELFDERLTLTDNPPSGNFVLDESSVRRCWPIVALAPQLRLPLLGERIARLADNLRGSATLSDYPERILAAVREMRL